MSISVSGCKIFVALGPWMASKQVLSEMLCSSTFFLLNFVIQRQSFSIFDRIHYDHVHFIFFNAINQQIINNAAVFIGKTTVLSLACRKF